MSDANNAIVDITTTNLDPSIEVPSIEVPRSEVDIELDPGGKKKQKREVKPRSEVWKHFIRSEKNPQECKCKYCFHIFSCTVSGGTTHLKRHIDNGICPAYRRKMGVEQEVEKGQTLLSFAKRGISEQDNSSTWKFDQEKSRRDLTELIINKELPFNFVEDYSFQKYVLGINPKVKFVSRNTVKNDCMKIYEVEKNKLKEFFLSSSPRVSLTTDTWTSK